MTTLRPEHIRELVEANPGHAVSMFLPTHAAGRERQQDDIRLKNLTLQATEQLMERGLRRPAAEEIIAPLARLPQDDAFWPHRSSGLACFAAEGFHRTFHVPLELAETLHISDRFHIKPLLPLLRSDARFYVLALSQDNARLFEATRDSIHELKLPQLSPTEIDGDEQPLQYHSHAAPTQGRGDRAEAIYHNQGGPDDRQKTDALKFFQRVDRAVMDVLHEQQSPLALACVGFLAPIYQSANRYPHLVKVKVPGSPDRWSLDELRRHAWQLIEPYLRKKQEQALAKFQRLRGDERTCDDIRDIVLAAGTGRVEAIFVKKGARQWGRVEPALQAVHLCDSQSEADEELVDYAAARTLANGGEVFVLDDLPKVDSPLAATLRY